MFSDDNPFCSLNCFKAHFGIAAEQPKVASEGGAAAAPATPTSANSVANSNNNPSSDVDVQRNLLKVSLSDSLFDSCLTFEFLFF